MVLEKMEKKIVVSFADRQDLSNKEIEDVLFWAVFEAKEKFGDYRVDEEMDFVFDYPTREVRFTDDGELNNFVHQYLIRNSEKL